VFIEIQRHKQFIMIFIIIFIGLPLAFFVPGVSDSLGGSGGVDQDFPIASVGSTPITAEQFMRAYGILTRNRSDQNLSTEAIDLLNDDSIEDLVRQLIDATLVTIESEKNPIYPDQEYLEVALKNEFKDADGILDAAAYNNFVTSSNRRKINWEELYDSVAKNVNRQLYLQLISSSAQVFEDDLMEEFKTIRSKMKVKYAAIDPAVEISDEDIRAHFNANETRYNSLEKRTVEYVSFSLKPQRPAILNDLVKRLADGEDFAELAQAHSVAIDATEGGDMGWIPEEEGIPEVYKPILALEPGEISDVIEQENGFTIYKSEEERVNEESGLREVHARQLLIRATLTEDEKEAISNKAVAFFAALEEAESPDFASIAASQDLTVETSPAFETTQNEIEGLEPRDVFTFRQEAFKIGTENDKEYSDVFEAQKNLFVLKLNTVEAPRPLEFDEAKETVERDKIAELKTESEYRNQMMTYITEIRENASSLEEAAELFPELNFEIKESSEFGIDDFLFSEGIFWQCRDAFGALADRAPGTIGGPIADFQGLNHFLELVSMTPPDEADFEILWAEQRDIVVEGTREQARLERQMDYLMFLSEKAYEDGIVERDNEAIYAILGLNDEESDDPFGEIIEIPAEDTSDAIVEEIVLDTDLETEVADPIE